MSRSQETSQRLTGGEHEQQSYQSPAEYIRVTTDPEKQRERSQEIINAADKMLTRGEDGNFTGHVDTACLDADYKHLSFISDYRGRDEETVLLTGGQSLEQAIDEVLEPATEEDDQPYTFYRWLMRSETTPENVTAKRILRAKVAAEVMKAWIETEQREEPSADDTWE